MISIKIPHLRHVSVPINLRIWKLKPWHVTKEFNCTGEGKKSERVGFYGSYKGRRRWLRRRGWSQWKAKPTSLPFLGSWEVRGSKKKQQHHFSESVWHEQKLNFSFGLNLSLLVFWSEEIGERHWSIGCFRGKNGLIGSFSLQNIPFICRSIFRLKSTLKDWKSQKLLQKEHL